MMEDLRDLFDKKEAALLAVNQLQPDFNSKKKIYFEVKEKVDELI